MDVTVPDDLTGQPDNVTDLDALFSVLTRAASSVIDEDDQPPQEQNVEDTGYKGFRLRWRKRPLPETEDVALHQV